MPSSAISEAPPLRVLLIGASGVFGTRLAECLALEQGFHVTLAGRTRAPLEAVAALFGERGAVRLVDRNLITPDDLVGHDVVLDAAGPFQASHARVIEAAIVAGVDYLDLADGREFVTSIGRFDTAARAAGIAVVTGASSIPALSHAVIDALTAGWRGIDRLSVGIFPGNRAPRGLSVVEAILSYVGRPVCLFHDGRWTSAPGWGLLHRASLPGIGRRWASLCDTPDLDLLVERYRPRRDALFFAGMELSVLHLGLALLALPVRWGLLQSLRPAARALLFVARLLLPFGTDCGAMLVEAHGEDGEGRQAWLRWSLAADANRGPYVPVLAALAMLRRRRAGRLAAGARACVGELNLAVFSADFDRLGMKRLIESLGAGRS